MPVDPALVLEVITRSGGLDANLAPVLHENSKRWPCDQGGLQDVADPTLDLFDVLAAQTSSVPVPGCLRPLLAATQPLDDEITSLCRPVLRAYVLAWRVPGLSPASFYYAGRLQSFVFIRSVAPDAASRVVPSRCDLTPFDGVIVLCGSVTYDGAIAGERRYRNLLIAAGIVCGRIVVQASRAGVTTRPLADFFDDPLAIELGMNADQQPLCAIAFRFDALSGGAR